MELSTILSHLDDVYDMFVEQALELATAKKEIDTMKLHVAERDQRMESYADAARQSVPQEKKNKQKSTRPDGSRREDPGHRSVDRPCTANLSEGWEGGSNSLEKRVKKIIKHEELKIEVPEKPSPLRWPVGASQHRKN